jgi:PAS domain-containing protein
MQHSLSPQTLVALIGAVACIGVILSLAVFLLQRNLGRKSKDEKPRPLRIRPEDEAAFTLTAIKSVVAQLKAEQKTLQEQLAAAERNVEATARKLELLAREIEHGMIVFDAQGYIALSNPQARKMLGVDTWSRRRYTEIFQEISGLPDLVQRCFEEGTERGEKSITVQDHDGTTRQIQATALPSRDRMGAVESVICVFRETAFPPANS